MRSSWCKERLNDACQGGKKESIGVEGGRGRIQRYMWSMEQDTEKEKQRCKEGLVLNVEGMKMPENEIYNGAMCLC